MWVCSTVHLPGKQSSSIRGSPSPVCPSCTLSPPQSHTQPPKSHQCRWLCCAVPPGVVTVQQQQDQAGAAAAWTKTCAPPVCVCVQGREGENIQAHTAAIKVDISIHRERSVVVVVVVNTTQHHTAANTSPTKQSFAYHPLRPTCSCEHSAMFLS